MNRRVSRRGFLAGLVAAPTIIGIDRRMKFFTPLRLVLPPHFAVINPGLLIVPPELQAQAQRMLDSARFRELIEPGLREVFASAYDQEVA